MGCCRSVPESRHATLEDEDDRFRHGQADVATGPKVATQEIIAMPPDIVPGHTLNGKGRPESSLDITASQVVKIKQVVNRALLMGKSHKYTEAFALLNDLPRCKEVETAREVLALCEAHYKDEFELGEGRQLQDARLIDP